MVNGVDLLAGTFRLGGGTVQGGTWDVSGGGLIFGSGMTSRQDGTMIVGDLNLSAADATLHLLNGSTFSGNATLSGSGESLVFEQTATLDNKTITFAGADPQALVVPGGHTLTLGPNTTVTAGAGVLRAEKGNSLVNQGLVSISVPNTSRIQGQFTNEETVEVANAANLFVNMDTFVNESSLRISGGGTLTVESCCGTWVNTASGTIEATNSSMRFLGNWDNDGALILSNSTLLLEGAFSTENLGVDQWTRTGGTVNLAGTLLNAGANLVLDATTGSLRMA